MKMKQQNFTIFIVPDNPYKIDCWSYENKAGFAHKAKLYKDNELITQAKCQYYNRTWESFVFESVIKKVINKAKIFKTDKEKTNFLNSLEKQAEDKSDQMFNNLAKIAKFGSFFGETQTQKNDWQTKILKAGLGDKGLIMSDDWKNLSENEKTTRLNKVIEFMQSKN